MYNSNNNRPRRTFSYFRLIVLGIAAIIFAFTWSPALGLTLLICIPVLVIIIVVFRNIRNSGEPTRQDSAYTGITFIDPPLNTNSPNPGQNNRPAYPMPTPPSAPDAHLCDDGGHGNTDASYTQSLNSMQSGYSGSASPTSNKPGTVLSRHDRQSMRDELDGLLDAGVITREEHAQRVREL